MLASVHRKTEIQYEKNEPELHCPKTKEMEFNLGMLNLYETHFKALFSVNYPYSV